MPCLIKAILCLWDALNGLQNTREISTNMPLSITPANLQSNSWNISDQNGQNGNVGEEMTSENSKASPTPLPCSQHKRTF